MGISRTNDTNSGVFNKDIGKGQTLRSYSGKDSSDYAGKPGDELPNKLKMGGGSHDTSKTGGDGC